MSDEIFTGVSETYRKIRNTFRILLANLYDFDPAASVPVSELDRWLLSRLQALVAELTQAYEEFEFRRVYHLVNAFCAVELSSFYVDVTKDLMYTLAPHSPERRSAQAAMHRVVMTLAKLIAPIMPFTADEVWSFLPGREAESVHAAEFPVVVPELRDTALEARWEKLIALRTVAAVALEKARQEGVIGKSLEAQVQIEPDNEATREWLAGAEPLLETILIVSQVKVGNLTNGELRVTVSAADGQKCGRCWRWTRDVGVDAAHPVICARCAAVVREKM